MQRVAKVRIGAKEKRNVSAMLRPEVVKKLAYHDGETDETDISAMESALSPLILTAQAIVYG